MTGGSAPTTGICDTPYSRKISMASRTVSDGWVCTKSGSAPDFPRSTSPTVGSETLPSKRLRKNPYEDIQASLNTLDKYPRPPSGNSTTTSPSGPTFSANRIAATTAMPQDPPTNNPSSRASRRVISKESASDTAMTSSTTLGS
ncbi:Uncharacterised protein [Mycobacteroides abscessus subsp. abscessus]|nr:Uncharacterised protein [Mycobacteroides abscessus subsp. abscessus]